MSSRAPDGTKPLPPLIDSSDDTQPPEEYFERLPVETAKRYKGECQYYACHAPRAPEAPLCAEHELQFWSWYGVPSVQSPLTDQRVIWATGDV